MVSLNNVGFIAALAIFLVFLVIGADKAGVIHLKHNHAPAAPAQAAK